MNAALRIALVGNPNCGKTALFNQLTGSRQKVANYAGVTVERKEGRYIAPSGRMVQVLDLPGAYSLAATSPDEAITRDIVMGRFAGEERPDLLVCVADATNLRLHLRFVLELQRLGLPMVLTLNMSDAAERRGIVIDRAKLQQMLGIPVVETIAVKRGGAAQLLERLDQTLPVAPPGLADSVDLHVRVVQMLNPLPIDLLEISGGSYEAPAMQGEARDGRTLAREAYFLEFAREIAGVATMPVMVTGGIRRRAVVEQVLASGVAMAGIATAIAINPNLPREWRQGLDSNPTLKPITWKAKPLAALAYMAVVKYQLRRLSKGRTPNPEISPVWALLTDQIRAARRTRQYRRWVVARSPART